jgi:hypothetical protein
MAGEGFRKRTPEERRKLGAKGGRAAQKKGTGYRWTAEEAREMARKGGLAKAAKRKAVAA